MGVVVLMLFGLSAVFTTVVLAVVVVCLLGALVPWKVAPCYVWACVVGCPVCWWAVSCVFALCVSVGLVVYDLLLCCVSRLV